MADSVSLRKAGSFSGALYTSTMFFDAVSDFTVLASDTLSHSLKMLFAAKVAHLRKVERIFWRTEDRRVRVWTIIDQPELETENQIYDAQLEFMDLFPEISFDFSVIFRQGQPAYQIRPAGTTEVYSRA